MCICNVGKDDICKVTVVMKLIKFLSLILQNMECKSLSDQYAAQVTALTSLKDEVISQDCSESVTSLKCTLVLAIY